jgi:hypothetical protein
MFRVCGPGRTLPTGTLSILDDDGDGNAWFMVVMDDGQKSNFLVKGYRVGDLFSPTAENQSPCGTVTGMVDGRVERTWHYFKELPVTGERIVQTVSTIGQGPRVRAK